MSFRQLNSVMLSWLETGEPFECKLYGKKGLERLELCNFVSFLLEIIFDFRFASAAYGIVAGPLDVP